MTPLEVRQMALFLVDEVGAEADPVVRAALIQTLRQTTDSEVSRLRQRTAYELRMESRTVDEVADLMSCRRQTVADLVTAYCEATGADRPPRSDAER